MKKLISVILLTISCFSSVLSQYSVIRISDISLMANEVTIMINPKNTNQVVAGSNAYTNINEMSGSAFYYSTNVGS